MNKERELAKNTAIISLGKICTQLISFFLLPLYTSILDTSEYGIVDLAITYSSLFLPIVTLALEQALFRFLIDARNKERDKGLIISTGSLFLIVQSFLICIVLFIINTFIKSELLFYFAVLLITSAFSAWILQLSRGVGDNIGYAFGSMFTAITQICCNIIFLVILGIRIKGMLLAHIVANIVCTIIISYRVKIFNYLNVRWFNYTILKEMLQYSLPLIPNQLSWWALNASDKVIVQVVLGVAANGLIAIANKFSSLYIQFSIIFNVSWTESAALHIDDDDVEQFFTRVINRVYKLFLSVCCGIIVCIPFVFSFLINEKYDKSYDLIPIFMIASLFNVVVSLYGVIYVARKRTKEIAQTAVYAASINIVSHLLLIKFVGIYAAAFSTMIGYGCMAIYRYFHSRRYLVVKLDNSTLLISVMLIVISLLSYYSHLFILNIIMFCVVVALSILLNYRIFWSGLKIIEEMFTKG